MKGQQTKHNINYWLIKLIDLLTQIYKHTNKQTNNNNTHTYTDRDMFEISITIKRKQANKLYRQFANACNFSTRHFRKIKMTAFKRIQPHWHTHTLTHTLNMRLRCFNTTTNSNKQKQQQQQQNNYNKTTTTTNCS